MSVGGDRTVLIWDYTLKKQLWKYLKCVLRVQDIVFNVDGLQLMVEVSNSWEYSEDVLFILLGRDLGGLM